jgi:uncharacterized protein (TIGR03437 family)
MLPVFQSEYHIKTIDSNGFPHLAQLPYRVEWDSAVCHKWTIRAAIAVVLGAACLPAQTRLDWRKVGPYDAELSLASPATGPVSRVWFSPEGSTLLARTASGQTYQTADFETWSSAPSAVAPALPPASAVRLPEDGATLVPGPDRLTIFALKRNLYRSQDGGRSWENLTADKSMPVIGEGQRSVAVWPQDPNVLVVANDYGVWRTADGGLTWTGLNADLPNLPVQRILSTPAGGAGIVVQTELWGALELPPGAPIWAPVAATPDVQAEDARKSEYSARLGSAITAVAGAGDLVYAGSSDGRIWFSADGGRTFETSTLPQGVSGPVTRIYAAPSQPRAAVAVLAGDGVHVLRTFTGGAFWDAIDSNLPKAAAYGVTADPGARQIYVATGKGVFWASVDLLTSSAAPSWTDLSAGLPGQTVYDVRLDGAGAQLYIAIPGYGVYAVMAPHNRRNPRVLSSADFGTRPAAPGALLSILGANVQNAEGAGLNYPVLGASTDSGSQIQVPFGASGPMVQLSLVTTSGPVTLGLPVQPVSPAIFVSKDGAPMLYDADTELPLDGRNPARSGGRVQIFATGLGRVQPEWTAGLPTPLQDPPKVSAQVKAFLDGAPLQVTRATLAPGYVGFYVVEVQLPAINNFGGSLLYISADGQDSNRVPIVIEP